MLFILPIVDILVAILIVNSCNGFSLLLFALLVRLITGPLTKKSYESTQKMQKIQPQIKKIQEYDLIVIGAGAVSAATAPWLNHIGSKAERDFGSSTLLRVGVLLPFSRGAQETACAASWPRATGPARPESGAEKSRGA